MTGNFYPQSSQSFIAKNPQSDFQPLNTQPAAENTYNQNPQPENSEVYNIFFNDMEDEFKDFYDPQI